MLGTGCLFAEQTYRERERELCHPGWGCVEVPWWPDRDGDGFGDPGEPPVLTVDRPEGVANNALDCDDRNPEDTARVQALCPADFLDDPGSALAVDGTLELLHGAEPATALEAHSWCGPVGWGGRLGASEPGRMRVDGPVWVALDPYDLMGWEAVVGFDALVPGRPVYLEAGEVRSGTYQERRPFFCTREAPDPADWYTARP